MAEFTADLNPKATNQLSLSDLLKIGNYMNQMEISGYEAELAKQKKAEIPAVQAFIKEGAYKKEDGSFDYAMINKVLPAIAPVSGPAFAKNLIDLGKNDIEARSAKSTFNQNQRAILGNVYGAYAVAGTQDPKIVIAGLNRVAEENPELKPYVQPAIKNLMQVPPGPAFNKQLYQVRNEFMTPTEQIAAFGPKAGITTVGGQTVQTTTQPSVTGEQPSVSLGTAPTGGSQAGGSQGGAAQGGSQPTGGQPSGANLPNLLPVRESELYYKGSPSILNLNEAQKSLREEGEKEYRNAITTGAASKEAEQSIRKVRQYINEATGNVPGKTVRKIGQWFAGNPELETLNKNLADLYVRQTSMMGAGTDQAKADVSKITGNENITAEALKGIMDRIQATTTAATAYQKGLDAFRKKHGDINGSILYKEFQNAWSKSYDPRVFMLKNINSSDMTESEKKAARAKLGEGMSEKDYQDFTNNVKTIERLERGLYQ